MELELVVREISTGLKSTRATERKKNAELLKDFLTGSVMPPLLTKNTLHKKGYTWNNVFDDIYEYILKEAEKFETSKVYSSNIRPLCSTLLHSCVLGSNRGKAYINSIKITDACLHILNDSRLVKAIGDEYLSLLVKHVLCQEHYLSNITPNSWKDLLEVCIAACFSNDFQLDNYTKLRLVHLVMKSGRDNCQFIKPLISSLSMVDKCFSKVTDDKKAQDIILEIVILLLENLSMECRLTMCHFTERILPSLIKCYDQNKEQKKKSSIFKILNLTVVLHHPQGRLQNEDGSLANDWGTWNKYLNSIAEIICIEVGYLQKSRKQNEKTLHHCTHFYQLAAFIHYQMFRTEKRAENNMQNPSKRQKLTFNKNKTFNDILNEMHQNHVPWLGIVHAYVQKYSMSVSASDCLTLLNYMQILLTNDNYVNWESLEELASSALKILSSQTNKGDEYDNTLISLWNTCARNCTAVNTAHKSVHTIMQCLLNCGCLRYEHIQHFIKLYFEKDMPVTDCSVKTLINVFHKFYNKCSMKESRVEYFNWLTQGDILCIRVANVSELLSRLIASENVHSIPICTTDPGSDLREILFYSIEKSILFSEFEEDVKITPQKAEVVYEQSEMIIDVANYVEEYFKTMLNESISMMRSNTELLKRIKLIYVVLSYFDVVLKYMFKTREEIIATEVFALLKTAMKTMFSSLTAVLHSSEQVATKVALTSVVQELLMTEFDPQLGKTLRLSIDGDFFYCVNKILNTESKAADDDIISDVNEREEIMKTLKHNCIYVLAAYCRKNVDYRDDLLKLILNPDLYEFSSDMLCVLRCMEILKDSTVDDPPLDSIFTLMQFVCKDWYRNSKVSLGILRILVDLIDHICVEDNVLKENCIIMVRGYMKLCEDMHYSPQVASYIYECVAKIAAINRKQNNFAENTFEKSLTHKLKGDVHSIRLYCCYLLKMLINNYSEEDIEVLSMDLLEIFVTDVLDGNEHILKDESANRTLTVLHTFLAMAQGKKSSIQFIILQVINVQNMKSLDKNAVKKVLNKIIEVGGIKDLKSYLNNNILPVIHFWFSNNYTVEKLPLYLFEIDNLSLFIKVHMKWLVAADLLWRKQGNLSESDVVNHILNTQDMNVKDVLETCFSNIMLLCLPYVVSDKYDMDCYGVHEPETFNQLKKYASKILHQMREVFENVEWNSMFGENVGEILLLIATHLSDQEDAERLFKVKLTHRNETYFYPTRIFSAILDHFHDLTDISVIPYLCLNKTTTVFKILLELWKNVVQENIFQYKTLALHAYITFIKNIPLDCPSDVFVCNFVCKSFTFAIRSCCDKEELRVYIEGLKMSLQYLLPSKISVMRKSVLELLPVLIIKKEEGYQRECKSILDYLSDDMRNCLKESEDMVDLFNSISQTSAVSAHCSSMTVFLEKLKAYKISLKCPSHETLLNIRQFLKCNKQFVYNLWSELDSKRFSEDCKTSVIHQFVHSLSCIIKSDHDDKTIIEACNCLSEIGSYDLKTLVTVPPADPQEVVVSDPKEYFAVAVVKSLLEVLFDEDPLVIRKVIETLTSFLKCRRVQNILDVDKVQNEVLKPFSPVTLRTADTKINRIKVEEYCSEFANGVFLDALVSRSKNSDDWLKRVTCALLRIIDSPTKDIDILREVCILKSQVCRKILPALVGVLLHCLPDRHIKVIGEQINNFFNYIWEQTYDKKVQDSCESRASSRPADELIHDHNMVVQYMLDIVDFVRVQKSNRVRPGLPLKKLNYLELEYNKIAWAAAVAHQYWAAIYYGELWAVLRNNGVAPASPDSTTRLLGGEDLQQILRKCYVSIGEIDAIEGCGTAHLTIEDEKRKHLLNSGQYSDALLLYDIALSCGSHTDPELHLGVARTLHKSGMHHLALQYIKSQPDNDKLSDVKYECLSFLGDWSEFVDPRELAERSKQANCHQNSIVKAFQYVCLKNCLHIQNTPEHENKVLLPLNTAKLAVSRLSQNLNMENCQNVYKILGKIHLFSDIEDYLSVRTNKSVMSQLLQRWDIENLPKHSDFKHLETLISQRVLILEHAAKASDNLMNEISSLQIQYAKMALSNQRVELAQRLLTIAKKTNASKDIVLMESEILWAKGHKDIALSLLQSIVINQSMDAKLSAVSLRQYALWIAELKRDNPRDIINKYLIKSLRELRSDDIETRLKVYHDIAKFADTEYKQVVAYMKSSVFENRVKCVENMKGTASSLREKQEKTPEELKAMVSNKQFQALDEAEIANTRIEKDNFLRLAMRYYLLSLNQCNENNLSVFRVISLWLENREFDFKSSDGDNIVFEDHLHTIPSWKYITALPQLAPHLSNEENGFIINIKKIIERCAIEHPHHTLPILFGLKNSKKDLVILNASGSSGASGRRAAAVLGGGDARTLASRALVRRLAARGDALADIIAQMEKLCDAIISFANYKVQTKPNVQTIPDAEMIHKLKNLNAIPIPTATIRINADCRYPYIHSLHSFETRFELVGGVNCPKKINCRDSAGKNHVMLIKGRDDLRQDAVMQQVFNIVNALLEKDPVTSRDKLLIRTYKVVPMSRQSGVLEWCEGTITLGGYLREAHARYRPQDISCDIARKKMVDCHKQSNEDKLRVFNGILRQFKPVFNHFFTEHYLDPVTWYERRLAYTKSVATSSMLGYMLGLGDRHVFNILIDQNTAEVIHIDLGISFDQGKTLPTPETIPFRLTQDIISGFGSCGVEGTFRRCCEKTMQLLRDNQGTLLTILEVLLCDPLYSWSVKTAQQNAPTENGVTKDISSTDSNSGLAQRALLVVASKLGGTEAGVAGGVAAPGHVARLLRAATDSFNLCRLYSGWQPYL